VLRAREVRVCLEDGVREWTQGVAAQRAFSRPRTKSYYFHEALVTLCCRLEHGPRKLVAWVDKTSDVFSKVKAGTGTGPWRRESFFKMAPAGWLADGGLKGS